MALTTTHRVFASEVSQSATADLVRRRAFCSCGWASLATWDLATHDNAVREHLRPAVVPGVYWRVGPGLVVRND